MKYRGRTLTGYEILERIVGQNITTDITTDDIKKCAAVYNEKNLVFSAENIDDAIRALQSEQEKIMT